MLVSVENGLKDTGAVLVVKFVDGMFHLIRPFLKIVEELLFP